jgi:hypothetical protein
MAPKRNNKSKKNKIHPLLIRKIQPDFVNWQPFSEIEFFRGMGESRNATYIKINTFEDVCFCRQSRLGNFHHNVEGECVWRVATLKNGDKVVLFAGKGGQRFNLLGSLLNAQDRQSEEQVAHLYGDVYLFKLDADNKIVGVKDLDVKLVQSYLTEWKVEHDARVAAFKVGKPTTSFFAYTETVRDAIKAELAKDPANVKTNAAGQQYVQPSLITKTSGQRWKALGSEGRKPFDKGYQERKAAFEEQCELKRSQSGVPTAVPRTARQVAEKAGITTSEWQKLSDEEKAAYKKQGVDEHKAAMAKFHQDCVKLVTTYHREMLDREPKAPIKKKRVNVTSTQSVKSVSA